MNSKNQRLFKALGDETRLCIINLLKVNSTICGCKILEELSITQPTLSHHLKMLVDLNLIKCVKDGRWCQYSLNKETFIELSQYLNDLIIL